MGVEGVKNCSKLHDVIYERPQSGLMKRKENLPRRFKLISCEKLKINFEISEND